MRAARVHTLSRPLLLSFLYISSEAGRGSEAGAGRKAAGREVARLWGRDDGLVDLVPRFVVR